MINAAGTVGSITAALKLILLANLLLFCILNVFTYIEMSEAAAISNHKDTEATGDQILGYTRNWRLITRAEWRARPPTSSTNFTGPAPYVILHHSHQPGVCRTEDACKAAMRSMQNYHMDTHGWPDIGYSFAVGGDGNVYEGRGYEVVGAHAPNYNSRSIGLLLIGNFMGKLCAEQ
uniref:Peptidoglycan-recognition protein LB n=1 Tax=Bactrocera latifrons TaxID=174628 RepID=A0A0K8U1N8_BACLA